MHGDACRLAADQEPPAMVLMLTAADSARERVAGLSVGADDYLTKPADCSVDLPLSLIAHSARAALATRHSSQIAR
jgi:DNA-binding response OmpR family regulator